MRNKQQGFTLIELIVVIVILGILAATALPKFIDLKGDAQIAATKGVAGALSAGMAMNYAAKIASKSFEAVTDCNNWAVLQGGNPDASVYSITTPHSLTAGVSDSTCVVTGPGSVSTTFAGIGA